MTKKEYLEGMMRRDFIRFVLLRKPRLSAAEVSAKLMRVIDVDKLYHGIKRSASEVCDRYLAYDKLLDENWKVVQLPPDWLNPSLADKIAEEYGELIRKEYAPACFVDEITKQIERLTWLQGVDDMAENLKVFLRDVSKMAIGYKSIPVNIPDERELLRKYDDACRVTIAERIFNNNCDDVLEFRNVLLEFAKAKCESILYHQMARLYDDIAASTVIKGIIEKFELIHAEAKTELAEMSFDEHPQEWEREYSRLVPVDFFERNIEDIDAAMAFHIVLLQGFARHEKELKSEGYISESGELLLFTNPRYDGTKWMTANFSELLEE